MDKLYAKAIDELAHKEGTDLQKLVSDLTKHLAATGRTKLLPGIARELKVLEARRAKLVATVEVAHEKDAHAALAAAQAEGIVAAKAHVNPSLISGWRARSGATLVDRTAKQGLIELYRNVTTQ